MKALVITATQPTRSLVQRQGITRRMALFMDALAGIAHHTHIAHLVPPSDATADNHGLEQLQSQFWNMPLKLTLIPRGARRETFQNHYLRGMLNAHDQPLVYSFAGPEQADAVGRLLDEKFDLVFVHRLSAMCAVLRSRRAPPRVFFDLDDVEHRVRLRYATRPPLWPGKLAYAAHAPALLAAERKAIALARQTFVCSERDQTALKRWSNGGKVAVVPNALQVPREVTKPAAAPNLLFLGACDYLPNAEAAERMVKNIFPLILKAMPEARLRIAGKATENLRSRRSEPPNVEYLGYVGDLDGLYADTRVVCCPLLNGGGTRVKLIEAAGYGRPMVSTRIGAEGLSFKDGTEILLRDSDADFASACLSLLKDDTASATLGAAARARMQNLYDAAPQVERIRNLILSHLQ